MKMPTEAEVDYNTEGMGTFRTYTSHEKESKGFFHHIGVVLCLKADY